jgi:hypothetical protein
MNAGACLSQPTLARIGAGQPGHLMAGGKQFFEDVRTDEAGRTREEDTHQTPPSLFAGKSGGMSKPVKAVTLSWYNNQ